ncbi:hypothetical protein V5799_033521 [Amblyomma americanum]|uniref:Uncharacterized protein n=1 Tax=Amblyomma americanum TaxID=6943 RepID=A0AAQ4DN28_AMBAM
MARLRRQESSWSLAKGRVRNRLLPIAHHRPRRQSGLSLRSRAVPSAWGLLRTSPSLTAASTPFASPVSWNGPR